MNHLSCIAVAASSLALLACTSATPNYDAKFGDAVRQARSNMTLHPDAGKTGDLALGMDGKSAEQTILRYHGSFKKPPPAVNVINIGGPLGSNPTNSAGESSP